jgi:hypothetical protein
MLNYTYRGWGGGHDTYAIKAKYELATKNTKNTKGNLPWIPRPFVTFVLFVARALFPGFLVNRVFQKFDLLDHPWQPCHETQW